MFMEPLFPKYLTNGLICKTEEPARAGFEPGTSWFIDSLLRHSQSLVRFLCIVHVSITYRPTRLLSNQIKVINQSA